MPDHVHMSLRGDIEKSPQEIALCFQNNLAYALDQNAVWQHTYYVGTFSEYDMDAIRAAKGAAVAL
jgi:REP element-mobilizing transposase RayT